MCDQDEHAKEQGKEQKKLQQLQQQKQEQQVEDEGCPRETYAQLWDQSQAPVPSLDPAQYTQNNQR